MPFIGELSALLTAFLWSGTSIVFTGATLRVGAMHVNITRLIFATIYLLISIALMGLSVELSVSQFFYLALSGLIGLVFGDGYLFKAFQEIGARISMLIMAIAPAIAAVLAYIFLGEDLSIWGVGGIIITIIGIAIVILERGDLAGKRYAITGIGILYGFFGALGQGVGLIFAKMAFNEGSIHGFVATFVRIFASIMILLPVATLAGKYKNPLKVFSDDRKALLLTTIGSIIGPYLGITFSLIAIANTKVGIAATIMSLPPIIMLPMVRIVYKETLSWKTVAGAFVAVGGIAVLFLR